MDNAPHPAAAVRAYYEPYPSRESRRVSVVVTVAVSADEAVPVARDAPIAEVIVLDGSGSMLFPRTKLRDAKKAACAALDTLPDGTRFAVMEGGVDTHMIYPKRRIMLSLSARNRREAKKAIRELRPDGGGTVIGSWLDGARELLARHEDHRRHATLLTDGLNNQSRRALDLSIEACRPVLSCDARGIGADWDPDELLHIVEALHGSAPALSVIGDLAGDFTEVMHRLMGNVMPELSLRVRCGRDVMLAGARQSRPATMDMFQHITARRDRVTDFSLGPWGRETRDYLLTFEAAPEAVLGDAGHRVARIDLLSGPSGAPVPGAAFVDVHWTDGADERSELVEKHEQQRELAIRLGSGGRAWLNGARPAALRDWLRARAIARRLRQEEALGLLDLVLEGDNLRPGLSDERVKRVILSSTRTTSAVVGHEAPRADGRSSPPVRKCPKCGRIAPAGARFCETGDHRFSDEDPS